MRIKFPFQVRQLDKETVEVVTSPDGRQLVELTFHPCVEKLITEEMADKIHSAASIEVVRATITVSY